MTRRPPVRRISGVPASANGRVDGVAVEVGREGGEARGEDHAGMPGEVAPEL